MTNDERIEKIEQELARFEGDPDLGFSIVSLDARYLLDRIAKLEKTQQEIQQLWDRCEGYERSLLVSGPRLAKLERAVTAVENRRDGELQGHLSPDEWVAATREEAEALAACRAEDAV